MPLNMNMIVYQNYAVFMRDWWFDQIPKSECNRLAYSKSDINIGTFSSMNHYPRNSMNDQTVM